MDIESHIRMTQINSFSAISPVASFPPSKTPSTPRSVMRGSIRIGSYLFREVHGE